VTGLALVPLFAVIAVFGYVLLGSLGAIVASPIFDIPEYSGDPLLGGSIGLALVVLVVGAPPYLLIGAIYLALLRGLAGRGWSSRRLRRAALAGGIIVTAPLVVLVPFGAIFGLVVPLPGADAQTCRRTLGRTALCAAAMLAALVPLSFVAPHVG